MSSYFVDAAPFRIYLMRGNFTARDYWGGAVENTLYYPRMERAAGNDTATIKIYDDSGRTNLVDTLTVSGFGTDKWRYVYGFINRNIGSDGVVWDGYYQNLDIGEVVAVEIDTSYLLKFE